jgi:hypothetical protein
MSVLPIGFGSEEGGYRIERSLRFNSSDSAFMNRTPASAGNRKTLTWSIWVKRGKLANGKIVSAGDYDEISFSSDTLYIQVSNNNVSAQAIQTTAVYRDPSAWYHIVVAVDTTQATAANRLKLYVNGTEVTAFSADQRSSITQNQDTMFANNSVQRIGVDESTGYFDGYLTEVHFIDGSALDPTSFGEFNSDTGVWQPKAYTGSYGTNGFYLDFADNSGTTSTTLGADSSGNGNNWTPNNFSVTAGAGNDSLVDSPTRYGTDTGAGGEVRGNYATLNPLGNTNANQTIANGNLDHASTTSWLMAYSTLDMTSGKWYAEFLVTDVSNFQIGIIPTSGLAISTASTANSGYPGKYGYAFLYQPPNASKQSFDVASAYGTAPSNNDIMMIAFDADSGALYTGRNGTWFNSSDPATSTSPMYSSIPMTTGYFFASGLENASGSWNFGQRPFAYTAPSGFKALVTTNLPTPTIEDGGEYFNAVLWTGDGNNPRTVTGVGFDPDFVWIKSRSLATSHLLNDVIRGGNASLFSESTAAETANNGGGYLSAFATDGFTVTAGGSGDNAVNNTSDTYVAWNWKANGAGVSNTDGTITSTVSVNTTSGFSIVTYTGTGSAATVGHGLGVAPSMVITKNRTTARSWPVYHASLGADRALFLESDQAVDVATGYWNDTAPTSSVFSVANALNTNQSGNAFVAYCFAPVAGYSAFGSYTGNGDANGPFVYTGFRPRWVMYKNASSAGTVWIIFDTARNTYNFVDAQLRPNASDAENSAGASFSFDLLSNGFKVRSSDSNLNGSGNTMIYAAFAENPFSIALAR